MSGTKRRKSRPQPARGSDGYEGHLPMRGGVLSQIAAAVRLRQVLLAQSPEVTEGTAKHGLNDYRDIGREKHVMLLRSAVDGFFTADYLAARGLDHREATKHNDLVTQALDVVLTRWDQLAVVWNILPDKIAPIRGMLELRTGLSVELPLRLAAYDALYGYLHPFLSEISSWLAEPKLRSWWKCIERRARQLIKVSLLYSEGELDSHTVRHIRDGKALPKEGTLPLLARRLAAHSVRDRQEERDAQPAELELELRVAIAAAEHPHVFKRVLAPQLDDSIGRSIRSFRSILALMTDTVTEDLLRYGTQAASWPMVEVAYKATLVRECFEMVWAMNHASERKMAEVGKNSAQALRELAEMFGDMAAQLRASDPRPGADGPERGIAEHLDLVRGSLMAAAGNESFEVPVSGPGQSTEIEAYHLCMEAMAPWLDLSAEDKEKRLREAVRICARSAYAHRCLARHVLGAGRADEAIQIYRQAVQLNQANEEGRESLVLLLSDRGEHSEVLALTEQHQSSTVLRSARALALFELGHHEDAEKTAREILQAHPRHTAALRVLAACLRASGDDKGAREHERKAEFYELGVAPPGD